MNIEILISIFLAVISSNLYAQSIRGHVSDADLQPISSAKILLSHDELKLSTITNKIGYYKLNVPKNGIYHLQVLKGDKLFFEKDIAIKRDIIENIILELDTNTIRLNEVNISASHKNKLIDRKIDRIVFNFENSIYATGGDALDALKITPSLKVQNEKIAMIGKSSMSIMMNGRMLKLSDDNLINYLKTIKANDIKNIEVITNPPANYDAEGNSGLVNINLRKTTADNWNVSVTNSLKQSRYSQYDQSGSIYYHKNDLSFFAGALHQNGVSYYRTEKQKINYSDKLYNSFSTIKNNYGSNINLNSGIEYDFNKKISVGLQYLQSNNDTKQNGDNSTVIHSSENYLLATESVGPAKSKNNSLNIHSVFKLDTVGSNVSVNLDYFKYSTSRANLFETRQYNNFTDYLPDSFKSANNLSDQNIANYAAQIDVEKKLNDFTILYGSKISYTNNKSGIKYYDLTNGSAVLVDDNSDIFDYSEKLQMFYFSASKEFRNWESKVGLRMENTQTNGYSANLSQRNKSNYSKFFPTLYLLYKINNNYILALNYGKRIQRPRYNVLNPFVRYINPYTTSQGNPFLQPYYTHNIELSLSCNSNWTNTLYFSRSGNIFEQVNYISDTNINSATKYENFYNETSAGLSENYNFKPLKIWESTNSCTIYYKKTHSTLQETIPNFRSWSSFVESDNSLSIDRNKTLFFTADYWYQFREYNSIYHTQNYSCLDLGLKAILLNNKLTLSVIGSDIFRSQKISNSSYFKGIYIQNRNYEDRQAVRINVKYNFGNNKFNRKDIKSSNREEKSRS